MADSGTTGSESGQTPRDIGIAQLAAAQHGVVSLPQLRRLGLSDRAVSKRAAVGRLHRIHRGVYAVGHARLTMHGRWMAAVMACGPGAVLSHRSAAALQELRASTRGAIDVIAPGRRGRSRPGIDVHQAANLRPEDVTTRDGIPCTTPTRTIFDCAEVLSRQGLARLYDQGDIARVLDRRRLATLLDDAAGRRGAAFLNDLIHSERESRGRARHELEHRFLDLCEQADLEAPRVNARVEGLEVDFSWPRHRLIVETDGFATHGTRTAFERDRRRDQVLLRAGWRVARFTWRHVTETPAEVADTLRAALTSASPIGA